MVLPITTVTTNATNISINCLTVQQQQAFSFIKEKFKINKIVALLGYAGTGKTYLMNEIASHYAKEGKVCVTAPTHTAVNILKSKVYINENILFATTFSAIGAVPFYSSDGELEYYFSENGLRRLNEYILFVIDEASMLTNSLYMAIINSSSSARILCVGDPVQLKQIKGDRNLIMDNEKRNAAAIPTFMLSEIIRQGVGNPILDYTLKLRKHHVQKIVTHFNIDEFETDIFDDEGIQVLSSRNGNPFLLKKGMVSPDNKVLWDEIKYCFEYSFKHDGNFVCLLAYTNAYVAKLNNFARLLLYPAQNEERYIQGELLFSNNYLKRRDEIFTAIIPENIIDNGQKFTVSNVNFNILEEDYFFYYNEHLNFNIDVYFDDIELTNSTNISVVSSESEDELLFYLFTYYCMVFTEGNNKVREDKWAYLERLTNYFVFFSLNPSSVRTNLQEYIYDTTAARSLFSNIEEYAIYDVQKYFSGFIGKLKQINYGYATTVHKSQGSTYERVFAFIGDINTCKSHTDRISLVYVALTRAAKIVYIV